MSLETSFIYRHSAKSSILDVWLGSKCVYVVCKVPTLGTRPQLQTHLPPIYLWELFVTGVIFHPKFTTLQEYTHPFLPHFEDLHSEPLPSI